MKKTRALANDWKFQAILKKGICCKKVLSTLDAGIGGECNSVSTDPGSTQCGLATALMEFCFTDPDIGEVNPEKDQFFKQDTAKHYRDLAILNCDHIVYLVCAAVPRSACSGYLTAAINTGHTMMFTYFHGLEGSWDILKIATAKIMLKGNLHNFIQDHGDRWFFCKCKSDRITQCENMI